MAYFSGSDVFVFRFFRRFMAIVLVLGGLLGASGMVHAVDASRLLSQYGHTAWRLQDGELPAPAYPMAQTPDGYLWIGTQAGLMRFDGARFVALETLTRERLPNPFIVALLGARDGSLWIGTPVSLSRWKDGQLTTLADTGGVMSLAEDQDGKIWYLTTSKQATPLCEVVGAGVVCHGKDDGLTLSGICCDRMVTDQRGTFWLGTDTEVVRWRAHTKSASFPIEAKIKAGTPGALIMSSEPDGGLWVGVPMTGDGLGLQRLVDDKWQSFETPDIKGSSLAVQAMLRDRNGVLWVGTIDHGVYRIAPGHVDHFDSKDGLTSDSIYSFFEDREGNMWVATSAGIDRFRDFKVWSHTTREGLSVDEVDSVAAGHDGKIWIGTANSLDVLEHGRIRSLRAGKELPGNQVTSLQEDDAGRLWVGLDEGLWIYADGKFTVVSDKHGDALHGQVADLAQDTHGDMWAALRAHPRRLVRIRGDRIVEEFLEPAFTVPRSLASDHRGGLWLGLVNGDLAHLGSTVEHVSTHLAEAIKDIIVTADGLVIGGNSKGLIVSKGGSAFRLLTAKDGLPCDAVNGLIEGDHGALWLYMGCGLARVDVADIERALHDASHKVGAKILDVLDGVRPGLAPFQKAARAPDGTLWFANGVVLQTLDPHAGAAARVALPVHIEQLIADRKPYGLSGNLALPALTRDVQLDYTAIGLAVPQRIRFRYRLDGHDSDWIDAGPRRQAFYTDLPPGKYRFHVSASRGDGVWEATQADLDFTILPAFYQTRWFILLIVVLSALLLWIVFAWRLAHVKVQMRALFEERHAERERIARELHDTFLQAVQGLMLRFQSAMERIPPSQPARELMENALDHADEVIIEGRDRVTLLRSQQRDRTDLTAALQQIGENLARDSRITFTLTVEGAARSLDPAVGDEVQRIAQEALQNAFRHAQATHIDVSVAYGRKRLTLSVVDNGRGFDAEGVIKNGPMGHWGLQGMHERATGLHARLTLSSRIGAGTALELSVPAAIAFRRPQGRWRRRMSLLRLLFATRGVSGTTFKDREG